MRRLHVFFFFYFCHLLAYWDSTWVLFFYLISGSVLKVWVVHWDYIECTIQREGGRTRISSLLFKIY